MATQPVHNLQGVTYGLVNERVGNGKERLSVSDAAKLLGVTTEAIRQRIRRETIEYEKTEDGRYYVYITPGEQVENDVHNPLVDRLINENEFLRRELERKDAILLSMTEGLKALEAPREPRESPTEASAESEGVRVPQDQERPSWWRRLFGVE